MLAEYNHKILNLQSQLSVNILQIHSLEKLCVYADFKCYLFAVLFLSQCIYFSELVVFKKKFIRGMLRIKSL